MSPPPAESNAMEDGKSENGGDQVESRFFEFCKNGLALEEKSCKEAANLFGETKHILLSNFSSMGNGTSEEAERYWFAFILYSVKKLIQKNDEGEKENTENIGLSLCRILRAAKLNIADFFKELPQFVVKAGPTLSNLYGTDWENRLEAKEMHANAIHLKILSKYYKRVFGEFFVATDTNAEINSPITVHASEYHRFGWLLFLALRVHAFSRFKDLVTCTNGLISILAILIIHVPTRFWNFNIHDSSRFVKKSNKGVDLLASLCNIYNTSEDELRKTMEKANNVIADILKKQPCLASECETGNLENIDKDGLTYFKDLMEESSLPSSLSMLEKDYDYMIHNKSELDERLFINEDDSLLASVSLSGGSVSAGGVKRKFDSMASPAKTITSPLSPHRSPASHANGIPGSANSKMAATPVSTAMTTAKWLRTVISPLPSKPSPELERFLTSCDRDATSDVVRRAQIILQAIFPSSPLGERCVTGSLQSANVVDNIWAEQRRLEALKLYYRVLEAMCRAEAQVLHATNLTSLLTNERFHRCMLACSAELVLATHKTVTMLFPAVLERTGITAFDLSKVIESFIRHEESLPRELRRHLNSLEERLLESMVWEKGSSMHNSLAVARPSLSAEINSLGLLAEPMPSLDEIAMHINFSCGGLPPVPTLPKLESPSNQNGDIRSPKRNVLMERNSFTSPVKDCLLPCIILKSKLPPPPLQSAFASPTKPNPGGGGETCAETGINIFFGKIIKLGAVRISGMVERLQLSQQIRENVYSLFQRILNQWTSLFFNRHIDQIILCCFYGVAKISQLNLTFKEIVYNYRKQPHCKPQVFRSVFVDWSLARRNGRTGQEHIDIITFYNEIFIPSVKPLLVELGPAGPTTKSDRIPEVNKNDGHLAQCPGSPKISPFPTLPDMSPKKVSATHNVYVSPLRSSKMEALISHSSKSYYACVGESTHAYQSPSKDLTAINNRLNGNRKVRGPLNFDDVDFGLVSDSMVANSLYLQNGSCASSSGAPFKSEQPDS
ncbi:retinoblastoma-related protein 1-like [Glycine soja]|uniref:Retinoblastoma-related protein 1 isoform A n=1 Tax=Glycine soja TaxID=3848 RepID=A0A445L2C0_GLYSO|nr:retinoblastoma-related protein 1-like [Glycine soja]RZC17299.1 Retinoblastoma-related protein 1 isoform A [Glycine soja]RZC17300.1 Retinoblastoma-related protein 1 isoform B [Glycine soja]RZC17301.1 Retinoblastoma-related protein 1 isoform C [Glycine soja]RZC17302.1 Retinoblastoma-related protein 1 isoform D [Glycine soja]